MADKLQELILYIVDRCEGDKQFGSTKLNKILFYSDFIAYAQEGHSITGSEYQKLQFGPCARPFIPATEALTRAEALLERTRSYHGYTQKNYIALRDPDLSPFSGQEIAIVDEVIELFRSQNATGLSELSHSFRGWQVAEMNQTIPYETVWVSDEPLSSQTEALAASVATIQ